MYTPMIEPELHVRVWQDARLGDAWRASYREGDTDTVDLLTGVISEFEKHTWFLRATLAE